MRLFNEFFVRRKKNRMKLQNYLQIAIWRIFFCYLLNQLKTLSWKITFEIAALKNQAQIWKNLKSNITEVSKPIVFTIYHTKNMGFMYYIYLIFFSILAMRETQKEGKKLALLNKYKRAVVRVQLPDRHVIQAVFPPGAGNFFNNVCQGDLSRCIDNNTIRRYRILIYFLWYLLWKLYFETILSSRNL